MKQNRNLSKPQLKPSPLQSQSSAKPSSTKLRILIADDHPTFLAGLVSIINMMPDMIVVGEASDGQQAVTQWLKHRPDLTLLDLRMPKMDGVATIEEIRRHEINARIIILTTFDTDNEIHRAFKAGAKGFLLKDTRREQLLECIRKVSRDEVFLPQSLMGKLAGAIGGETLTARELDVLKLLASGKSNKEIGASLFISETTVKGHLQHIFSKLHVLSRTEAIAVASHRGLIEL